MDKYNYIYDSYWLGGFYNPSDSNWHWITGEAWNYANWSSGEPNNLGTENCVEFYGLTGEWNNLRWDDTAVSEGHIIEYAVPEPSTITLPVLAWAGTGILRRRGI